MVLNTAFGHPTIAVDTHIFRVSNRTGLAPGKTPLAVELGLEKAVPTAWKQHAHHWLILHGRYVCKARMPDCPACRVAEFCAYKGKTTVDGMTSAKPARKTLNKAAGGAKSSKRRRTTATGGRSKPAR